MLATYLDLTATLNASNAVVIELSNYDYAVIQAVNPSGTINLTATNDSGAVQGTTDGNFKTATNFQTVQATKLADGTDVTAIAEAGLFRVGVVGRFLKIGGASAAADKLIVMLTKIS